MESQQTHLRFTNQRFEMPAPVVVYVDFESANNEKNKHKPIMLPDLAVSRIPTIHTQLQIFHAPHENESDLHPVMDYLIQLHESVKRLLFDELPVECSTEIENDYQCAICSPFCHKIFARRVRKVRHYAQVSGEYSNGVEVKYFEAEQYIFTCCTKCNLQLSFNKKYYRLPVYFRNGFHYDFTFIMKLIATIPGDLEVIPTTKD